MSMVKKLEITQRLESLARAPSRKGFSNRLMDGVAILNLPAPYYCERNCPGCITKREENIDRERKERLPLESIKSLIDFFADEYGTQFITINGRGDPFHPEVQTETLEKIMYAKSKGIQSYVFSAGDNLNEDICHMLAEHEVNVMMSLYGNPFADEAGENLRNLIRIYNSFPKQPEEGLTRIGMNYVVGPGDLRDKSRLLHARQSAHENGLFFVCNTVFSQKAGEELTSLASEHTDFRLPHSTFADGRCQMGAGSSITIAANGEIYRCPYMLDGSDGKISERSEQMLNATISRYLGNREYSCVIRKN